MADDLPPAALEAFGHFVEARAGLHFPAARAADLLRGLRAAAAELGFASAEACADWFVSERATRAQFELLTAVLTIGETYFFRDPKAFEAFENTALPELIRRRRSTGKRLRIWSAGCCTGEEPYSIAIAVCRALPDFAAWDIVILGTDINVRFLEKAAAGIFTKWSFRGVADEVREKYFRALPDGRFAIAPEMKNLVTFSAINLAEDAYPSVLNRTSALDVIFCRNVLMYFSRERAKRVTAALHRALVEGGWLFPSGTEASPELFGSFAPVEVTGAIVYRKLARLLPDRAAAVPENGTVAPGVPLAEAREPAPLAPAEHDQSSAAPRGSALVELARQLAGEGRFADALAACDEALAADKLAPVSHYLRGLILQEQDAPYEAAAALRRALYLDQDFVIAHFALGNLMRQMDRERDSARCFENVRGLLRGRDPDEVLPQSEGLTAGRLLAIVSPEVETSE